MIQVSIEFPVRMQNMGRVIGLGICMWLKIIGYLKIHLLTASKTL